MMWEVAGIGRASGASSKAMVTAAVLAFLHGAGMAAAQQGNEAFLDATFLAAPTDWCPADTGIPMVVKMDGPNIIEGPQTLPRQVRERRGASVRTIHSLDTASFNNPEDFIGPNAKVVGRFSAEYRTCFSPWTIPTATGSWQLSGNDGSDMEAGVLEDEVITDFNFPFFRSVAGSSNARSAQFGERLLFTAGAPDFTTTQMFLAKTDKE